MAETIGGTARKALNIFLRDACFHRILSEELGLTTIVPVLELPLDADVADGLRELAGESVPSWDAVKRLEKPESDRYQASAAEIADQLGDGWYRVHLDLLLWRGGAEAVEERLP